MERCPCGSGLAFKKCCKRLLSGKATAVGPLELMRSRYSAYATGEIGYIIKTTVPEKRAELDRAELAAWSDAVTWESLTILSHSQEGDRGSVEFIARYRHGDEVIRHHEHSLFKKISGLWLYDSGTFIDESEPQ